MLQLNKLPLIASLVARHLASYVELLADEAQGFGNFITRKLVLAAVTFLSGSFVIALGCAWIIIAAWDTQWRYFSIGSLWLLFLVMTSIALLKLLQRPAAHAAPFHRLRLEWDQDKELFDEIGLGATEANTNAEMPAASPVASMVNS